MMKEIFDRHNDMLYEARRKSSISDNIQNKINVCGLTKPAFINLRCGGTIARVIYYVEGVRHYFYGNIVLKDYHVGNNNPTIYVYAQNRLVRLDCEHIEGQKGSYRVHQIVPLMEYCIYERGDKAIAEYDRIRLDKYKNYVTNLK